MNCKNTTRLASDALERKLTFSERARLKLHLLMCSGCRNFADQMKILRQIGKKYAKGDDDKPVKQTDLD